MKIKFKIRQHCHNWSCDTEFNICF